MVAEDWLASSLHPRERMPLSYRPGAPSYISGRSRRSGGHLVKTITPGGTAFVTVSDRPEPSLRPPGGVLAVDEGTGLV